MASDREGQGEGYFVGYSTGRVQQVKVISAPSKGGRPFTLSPELTEVVCTSLRAGNYLETAAASAGVTSRSLRLWVQKGHDARKRKVRNRYRRFLDAIEKAQADGEVSHVKAVVDARAEHWQASAWWLERTRPERFGRRDKVLVENSVREELDGALNTLQKKLSAAEYERVLVALSDNGDGEGATSLPSIDEVSDPH